jgi:hypothetical protein
MYSTGAGSIRGAIARERKESERECLIFYSLEPSAVDGTRSSVDPRPQCIGAGSIHALNVSHQQRPIHCGCSKEPDAVALFDFDSPTSALLINYSS